MQLQFTKYQGTGNDFVIIDDRTGVFPEWESGEASAGIRAIKQLCDRHKGIGADGLMLLRNQAEADFEVVYFNADGTQSFCGNGARCISMYAYKNDIASSTMRFLATDGFHRSEVKNDLVFLDMSDVLIIEKHEEDDFLDTGSPHRIVWCEGVEQVDVVADGRLLRNHSRYGVRGSNINFAAPLANGNLAVRTYERGVENETLSCGTGVTAVSLSAAIRGHHSPVHCITPGGQLSVSFEGNSTEGFKQIKLIGPAQEVFQGSINL